MGFQQRDYGKDEEILIPGSILGYRQWYWSHGELTSQGDTVWEKGEIHAECKNSLLFTVHRDTVVEHSSPHIDCTCGIYAHYLPLESYERGRENVFGVVEASGKILMGTKGFRAEKTKIVALSSLGPSTRWFTSKEKTRGVYPPSLVEYCSHIGVPYFPTVAHMLYEFPQVDLSSLGVPSLDSWKEQRDKDKKQYELREKEAQAKLDRERELEKELTRIYGVSPSKRYMDTLRHLGGYS